MTKKRYRFYASMIVEAENEEQAKYIFADESFNFAADAEVEEVKKTKKGMVRQT